MSRERSNRSDRSESYDIISSLDKIFWGHVCANKEVGDTFVPYMEVWYPVASNDEIIG